MACWSGRKRRLRYYELMLVVSPQVDDEGMTVALDRVNRYVSDRGGSVVRQEQWGRLRRLAYPIRNFNEGNYVLTHLEMDPQDTRDLEASLHLSEDVLRHLLVRIDSIPPAPPPRTEPVEAAAESAAEASQAEAAADDAPAGAEAAAESTEAETEATQAEPATDETPASPEAQAPEAAADVAEPETSTEPAEAVEAEVETDASSGAEAAEEPPAEEPSTGEAQ